MTEDEVILEALAHPIGTSRLKENRQTWRHGLHRYLRRDARRQRMSVYLPYVVRELNAAGVEDKDIRFLSALGYHRKAYAGRARKDCSVLRCWKAVSYY